MLSSPAEIRESINRAEASKDEPGWQPLMFTAKLVTELLAALEAAEKERDEAYDTGWNAGRAVLEKERDEALAAKILRGVVIDFDKATADTVTVAAYMELEARLAETQNALRELLGSYEALVGRPDVTRERAMAWDGPVLARAALTTTTTDDDAWQYTTEKPHRPTTTKDRRE